LTCIKAKLRRTSDTVGNVVRTDEKGEERTMGYKEIL